jgi:hypothetical protein
MGFGVDAMDGDPTASAVVRLGYLALPIGGKYYFRGQETTTPYFRLGVLPSFLVSRTASVSVNGTSGDVNIDSNGLHTFDIAATIGAGFNLMLDQTNSFVFDLSYVRGLISIADGANGMNSGIVATTGLAISL